MSNLFSDPAVQVMSINDFTPGIHRWTSGGQTIYPASAPVGSAADAHRCYAIPGVGLAPFFTYQPCQTFTVPANLFDPINVALAEMDVLSTTSGNGDSLVCNFSTIYTVPGGPGVCNVTRADMVVGSVATPTTVYTNTQSPFVGTFSIFPNVDVGLFQNPNTNAYIRTAITTDSMAGKFVLVPNWNDVGVNPADSGSGNLAAPVVPNPRVFYHANRMGVWQNPYVATTGGFVTGEGDQLNVSAILSLAFGPSTNAGVFFPELGGFISTWGSISTGEFVAIYGEGGAVLIYGDLFAPTSVTKLPGVIGPGRAQGKGALSPVGLVYATDRDGVYVWNGGNSSQKISQAVPDASFERQVVVGGNGAPTQFAFQGNQAAWNQFVMFPNNWVFDSLTNAFWLAEDPAVLSFQVHTAGSFSAQYFYSSPGFAAVPADTPASITTYMWAKDNTASSYYWLSNPISTQPGALVTIMGIEITASNPSPTPANITITPQAPPGQQSFSQQNQVQPLLFTIPPNTTSWRGAQRSGYADYNTELAVTAANETFYPAPIIHEINVGFTQTRVSNIQ